MQRLDIFHQKLFKHSSSFPVTPKHRSLYEAFEQQEKRGYVLSDGGSREDAEKFLATFVLALHQTRFPNQNKVILAISSPVQGWATQQISSMVQHIFRTRKKASKETIQVIKESILQLHIGSNILQLEEEPEKWVAYGFHNKDLLPPWMRGRLIKV